MLWLVYLAETYYDYFKDTEQSLYDTPKVKMPKPDLYVLYTGTDKKNVPPYISLPDSYLGGDNSVLDFKVKVVPDGKDGDIIQQYVRFTKIYNEQVKLYGRNAKAVYETIRICEDENVLADYMKSREKEVSGIMLAFSDVTSELNLYVDSKVKAANFSQLVELVKEKLLTLPQAAKKANMTVEEFEEKSGLKDE